jgi:hypothetical protein
MGSFKLTGLSAGTAAGHSVRFEQLQTGTNKLITVAGTGDVITGVMTPTYGAYTNGDMFTFIVGSTNTTNVTINIDGLGAKAITNGTTALTAGALTASRVVVIQYDGTRFQLLNSYLVTPITGTTGSAVMPSGTTGQRDGSPSAGYIRYNTTTATFEGYGSAWGALGGSSSQSSADKLIAVAGTADVITGTLTPALTSYVTGDIFTFVVGSTNTTNVTINIDGLGAKAVTVNGSTALVAGALPSGKAVQIGYDGTRFQLLTNNYVGAATGTLPVANGGTGVTTSTGSGAVVLGTSPSISGAVMSTMASSVITSGTAVASTSGTSIDFTGIPSWVKRITVMFNGVSTSGTSNMQIQLGTGSTTYTTSGYLGAVVVFAVGTMATSNISTGFGVSALHAAANLIGGNMVLTNLTGNTWSAASNFGVSSSTFAYTSVGSVPLGAALTAVRITTVNGTDTFDAGSINILYE